MVSVNTNSGAMTALRSLNMTNTQLAATEKQISTGYKVADATDDGAAYAVSQNVRSNVNVLTAVNNQLGNAQGLMQVTNSAVNSATTLMTKMAGDLANLADAPSATQQKQYQTTYMEDVQQLASYLNGATYNGVSLVDKSTVSISVGTDGTTSATVTAVSGSAPSVSTVVQDESGTTYTINAFAGQSGGTLGTPATSNVSSFASANDLLNQLVKMGASASTATTALGTASSTQTVATFSQLQTQLNVQANTFAAQTNYVNNQVTFNSSKMDSLNTGLGSLVDADLAKESAALTSLQIKQQLGQQSLSIANQAPSGLVSLFR